MNYNRAIEIVVETLEKEIQRLTVEEGLQYRGVDFTMEDGIRKLDLIEVLNMFKNGEKIWDDLGG